MESAINTGAQTVGKTITEKTKMTQPHTCDVYSRVVGYFRPVSHWNPGKKEEFIDRKVFRADLPLRAVTKTQKGLQQFAPSILKGFLFTTKTCPNCQTIKPLFESSRFETQVVDAHDNPALVTEYDVEIVPTAVFVSEVDSVVTKICGADNIEQYLAGL